MAYARWKCKHCGRVEYYSAGLGARNWPAPWIKGCKRTYHGYHEWEQVAVVEELPRNRRK